MNRKSKIISGIAVAGLLLQCLVWNPGLPKATAGGTAYSVSSVSLKGTINGNLPIHMTVQISSGGKLTGSYYYDKYKKAIKITGDVNGSEASFTESDAKGNTTGSFEGWWLPDIGFIGAWVSPDRERQLPVEALTASAASQKAASAADWLGEWNIQKRTSFTGSTVEFKKITNGKILFSLDAFDGSHTGSIENGQAVIHNRLAVYKSEYGSIVLFYLTPGKKLFVESPFPVADAGLAVTYTGEYYKGPVKPAVSTLKDLGVFKTNAEDKAFKAVVGKDYELFTSSMQLLSDEEDLDGYHSRVISGGVRGLFTIDEAIIMYDAKGHFWAAALDDSSADMQVKFYTNVPQTTKLPHTIETWRERFPDYEVVFMSK